MMNPHGFVFLVDEDGTQWYGVPGVDGFIAELEEKLRLAEDDWA